jgi:hypothetical protein
MENSKGQRDYKSVMQENVYLKKSCLEMVFHSITINCLHPYPSKKYEENARLYVFIYLIYRFNLFKERKVQESQKLIETSQQKLKLPTEHFTTYVRVGNDIGTDTVTELGNVQNNAAETNAPEVALDKIAEEAAKADFTTKNSKSNSALEKSRALIAALALAEAENDWGDDWE